MSTDHTNSDARQAVKGTDVITTLDAPKRRMDPLKKKSCVKRGFAAAVVCRLRQAHDSAVARIEKGLRNLGAMVRRRRQVITPRLEGVVDVHTVHQQRSTVYEVESSLYPIRWDIMKAIALNADELQIVFPNQRLAHTARKLVAQIQSSGKATHLSILCLTTEEALRLLQHPDAKQTPTTNTSSS